VENNRIPQLINNLYNKIAPEKPNINSRFLQNIHFFKTVADELPSYFKKVSKSIILDHKNQNQRQVVLAFAVASENSSLNLVHISALIEFFTNTFSLDEFNKMMNINSTDYVYVDTLLKSAKMIYKF